MRDGDVSIPESRFERLVDRARHLYHRLKLPLQPQQPEEDWDPPLCELLIALLDD